MDMKISKQNVEAVTDLSPLQEGMLFEHMINPQQHHVIYHYHIKATFLDEEILRRALDHVTVQNDTLRTVFRWGKIERPIRIVLKEYHVPFHFTNVWSDQLGSQDPQGVDELLGSLREKIDIMHAPLHIGLLKTCEEEWHIVVAFHHILMDGWSNMLFMEQWLEIYKHLLKDDTYSVVQEKAKYSQFIEALRHTSSHSESVYWTSYLDGAVKTSLFKKHNQNIDSFTNYKINLGENNKDSIMHNISTIQSTLAMAVYSTWGILLQKYAQSEDVLFGVAVSGRNMEVEAIDETIGLFINTIPFRFKHSSDANVQQVLQECAGRFHDGIAFEHTPLTRIHEWSGFGKINRLFDTVVVIENYPMNIESMEKNHNISILNYEVHETNPYDITLTVTPSERDVEFNFSYNREIFEDEFIKGLSDQFIHILNRMLSNPQMKLEKLWYLPDVTAENLDQKPLSDLESIRAYKEKTLDTIFDEICVEKSGDVALVYKNHILTYAELKVRVDSFANFLHNQLDIRADDRVGICLPRSAELIIAILGVLRAGAAYVPIDPTLPEERIQYLVEDSGMIALVTDTIPENYDFPMRLITLEDWHSSSSSSSIIMDSRIHDASSLAYVIYTSGSTGKPKGVMVEHRNVIQFFESLNDYFKPSTKDALLSVTTVSFDISVLELLWTLCNGIQVVLKVDDHEQLESYDAYLNTSRKLDFSLYFFGNANRDKQPENEYQLLLESSIFADKHDFEAVWTPERHFHEFGGKFPNPAITSAAIAAVTQKIHIRAGSIVSPLQDSLHIAEDWAMIDQLSSGRVGVSFASGWHVDDFSLAPERFENKEEHMYKQIKEVKTLWCGGEISRINGLGQTTSLRVYPKPVQENLPIWITSAGNPDTFQKAGQIGANVLTHLLGQDLETLRSNIDIYRKSLLESGFSPDTGKVTLMIHTYLGDELEEVKKIVKEPFCNYLRSSAGLVQRLIDKLHEDFNIESEDEMYEFAFERYWNKAALFGTVETCRVMVDELVHIGVNEIASLIDFGIDSVKVLEGLERLNELRMKSFKEYEKLQVHKEKMRPINYFQTTPSRLQHIINDSSSHEFLKSLTTIIIGGEAFPVEMFHKLRHITDARIVNAYGPTETTIWSALLDVEQNKRDFIPIGDPLPGEMIYVVDEKLRPLPPYIQGEIVIGGGGVSRGYLNREQLTNEKFIYLPSDLRQQQGKVFRTGDLGVIRSDGSLEYLGRKDNQVKISGYRIELEEIEAFIRAIEGVVKTVVFEGEFQEGSDAVLHALIVVQPPLNKDYIREILYRQLPRYMVPRNIVLVDDIPLNTSGKIDRGAAKKMDLRQFYVEEENVLPQSEEEILVAEVWKQVLARDEISISDDFFSLGGDSIKAMRVVALLKKKDYEIDVKDIFQRSTIKSLIASKNSIGRSTIPSVDTGKKVPSSKRRSHYQYGQLNNEQLQQVEHIIQENKKMGGSHP
ncbi:LLM class flavin-dependent oxidoreductase [Paenibacillus sp. UMB7766-LJ446]|uniref:MupA/Atu3671 family FMN-dependent luciferase-like monooxygenase n=1 Tax=Paenibacillus sp. UMB7766-LJ446 TaxID=3046313 RepID=UPI00254F974E|nr:MupA/Atu3671 family FMN-dependent luciferase-like monooxygenase [Paenibacillus sp. UMB7766-LJ446]MDK8191943.1 LLM class flavin-dependent oxidoreductase [Paenibacillus sp. UMB7766-LJ446]